jgi:UDPglucose 6-dehydrogenase
MYGAVEGSGALVLVTEWHEYRTPDFARIKRIMQKPVLFDGRNTWVAEDARARGFFYSGIGRIRTRAAGVVACG